MNKLLENKKILIAISLALLLLILIGTYIFISARKETSDSGPIIKDEVALTPEDEYVRDAVGNIKRVLIIDNLEYKLEMDLLGTWKEYLLPIDERDKYQAFLIPNKNNEVVPYFYVSISKSESVDSKELVEEEIIYGLRNDFDSFELEQITKKVENEDDVIYVVSYKTNKNKEEIKNYQTIFYKDGYKISFTYSALSLAFAGEKGYIDDMINTVSFIRK